MQLAGGEADSASRVPERLGKNISLALATPSSEAAKAFKALGITEEELKRASTDLEYGLRLLAEKFVEFQDTPSKTAAYIAILGRGMEQLIPYFKDGAEGIDRFNKMARETGAVLDNQTTRAMTDTGEKIHVLSATLEGTGVKGFLALKVAIDTAIGGLTSFVAWVGSAITAVRNFNALPPPSNEGFFTQTGKWRTFHPNPNAPGERGGHWEQTGKWRKWVPDEMRPEDIGSGTWGGDVYGNGPANLYDQTGFPAKPVVPPLEAPEKAAKGGRGGRGRAAKDDSDADARELQRELEEEQRMREAALTSDQKIQDLKFTRYRDEINNELALGKISATQALRQEEELRTEQWTYDQAYFQKKIALAQGDAKETQKLLEEQAAAYEKYVTDIQNLDAKIALANQQAAQKSAQAFTQLFDQIGSTFTSTIAGLIQGTTTWQQGLQKIFDQILQSFIKMIGDMLSQWAASGLMSLGTGAGQGAGLGSVLTSALGSAFGGLFGGGLSAAEAGAASGFGDAFGAGALDLGLLAFAKGGIVPSAQGGWAVPSMGPGGVLAQLHSNEMVLPAGLSQFVQSAAAQASAAVLPCPRCSISRQWMRRALPSSPKPTPRPLSRRSIWRCATARDCGRADGGEERDLCRRGGGRFPRWRARSALRALFRARTQRSADPSADRRHSRDGAGADRRAGGAQQAHGSRGADGGGLPAADRRR